MKRIINTLASRVISPSRRTQSIQSPQLGIDTSLWRHLWWSVHYTPKTELKAKHIQKQSGAKAATKNRVTAPPQSYRTSGEAQSGQAQSKIWREALYGPNIGKRTAGLRKLENFTFCWRCIVLWFLVNDQHEAQFFTMYLFLFLTLYMFRERRELPTSTRHGHRHRVTVTRVCVDTSGLSWWWARCARNM
jgi:hypothetical protein